jgi:hypothetical protein
VKPILDGINEKFQHPDVTAKIKMAPSDEYHHLGEVKSLLSKTDDSKLLQCEVSSANFKTQ